MTKKDIKALFSAIRKHENRSARALLSAKPDLVNACASAPPKKDDGQSPLQVAFKTGNFRVARYLIKHGANVNFMEESAMNEWRMPVLHDALRAAIFASSGIVSGPILLGLPVRLIAKMLKLGADPNAVDSYGNRPLGRVLLDTHQMVTHPLFSGTYMEFRKIASLLLKAGADPDAVDGHGESAWDLAETLKLPKLLGRRRPRRSTSGPPT